MTLHQEKNTERHPGGSGSGINSGSTDKNLKHHGSRARDYSRG